jgi:hypothetical protein
MRHGDIANWFREYIKDPELADKLQALAEAPDSRTQALRLIRGRYTQGPV